MKIILSKRFWRSLSSLMLILAFGNNTFGYSVLTHQAIIDLAWKDDLVPLLLKRFPNLSQEQLREAHAYAYGGCIIQDMGYYPFSNRYFSDLLHYVRSGDFVEALISESRDANEYAFALGALSHYASDNNGHPLATNRAVPIYYPQLRRKYGDVVTYEQNPAAHIKAEFGFDVVQVARGNYAPEDYHDFIGFKVSKPLLDRALQKTYGLELKDIFYDEDLAFDTYRHTVSKTIPYMTKVAWEIKKDEIGKLTPGMTGKKFIYKYSVKQYKKEFGKHFSKTSPLQKFLGVLFRLVPKIGPLKAFEFKPPTPETERLFLASLEQTLATYKALLAKANPGHLNLENRDYDTGNPTRAGEYRLTDKAYGKLLDQLAKKDFKTVTPELKAHILNFFSDTSAPIAIKKDEGKWRKTLQELEQLKVYQPQIEPAKE